MIPSGAPMCESGSMRIGIEVWLGPMTLAFGISLIAIGLASLLGAGAASAGGLVEFSHVSERGPATLVGYLARPDKGLSALLGAGRPSADQYPAVVVLHGCSGISSHSAGIADRLGSWGYVALAVDSLGPRGVANRCNSSGYPEQAFDAYAALRYLAQQGFVDATRIAVLGQSMGGIATLYAVDRDMAAQYFTERFRAAIAYYPACVLPLVTLTAPTLILTGEQDDWTPAERCREMVAHARPDSAPIALHVYPDAHHAFDVAALQPGRRAFGHLVEYNESAAKDAEEKTRAFLAAHLAGTAGNRR
jgi:dienelactone hydrolase